MKIILLLLIFVVQGCISMKEFDEKLQKTFSKDGMTNQERVEFNTIQERARVERVEKENKDFEDCIADCKKKKYTDMQTYKTCLPPNRQGLAKNNIATFYLWYDGQKPTYIYFDRKEKFIISELDQDTINARTSEYIRSMEVAETQRLMRLQIWNSNNNANELNNTIRKQNCINNSTPNTVMYCN